MELLDETIEGAKFEEWERLWLSLLVPRMNEANTEW